MVIGFCGFRSKDPISGPIERKTHLSHLHPRETTAMAGGAGLRVLPHLVKTLQNETPKLSNQALPSLRRAFSLYDQINLIDNVPEDQLRFQGYTDTGFTVNGVKYEGSLLVIDNKLMSWSPKRLSEITAESLSIFQIVRPIPEILILGCGRHIEPLSPELRSFIRSTGMKLEAVDSRNAASTFNILNEEGRVVAAALLPYGVTSQ
ncbi:hypothetical protein J5N97_008326 [Dioscorea zingiberensis]|uniref:NADH dehydrogenase [ubiquinone] 1 alpha subcomplex assembly factor 3 n=1 Tax=Dioscorea zingiberensis TaxID=325984 RepID=A0A9D5HUI2_9LILI|nr:hypothetical protein J5N97_008326 [Dioscorea zingiberensis]